SAFPGYRTRRMASGLALGSSRGEALRWSFQERRNSISQVAEYRDISRQTWIVKGRHSLAGKHENRLCAHDHRRVHVSDRITDKRCSAQIDSESFADHA